MTATINTAITAWVRKRFITATDGSDSYTRPGAYGAPDPHGMQQTYRSPAVVAMLPAQQGSSSRRVCPLSEGGFCRRTAPVRRLVETFR
jgi:hypothetical protein